ncbi:unnamed protein product [Lampetra fluviatilis]
MPRRLLLLLLLPLILSHYDTRRPVWSPPPGSTTIAARLRNVNGKSPSRINDGIPSNATSVEKGAGPSCLYARLQCDSRARCVDAPAVMRVLSHCTSGSKWVVGGGSRRTGEARVRCSDPPPPGESAVSERRVSEAALSVAAGVRREPGKRSLESTVK